MYSSFYVVWVYTQYMYVWMYLCHTDPLLHEARETPDFCITCYIPVALFPDSPPPTQDPGNKVACPPEVSTIRSLISTTAFHFKFHSLLHSFEKKI